MRRIFAALLVVSSFILGGSSAFAGICDYRLSSLIGAGGTNAALGVGGTVAGGGGQAFMAIAGLYFFPHAAGGLMLGSTLAGTSAAGTIGIMGGSGFFASVLATLTAPVTLVVAAGTTVTVGGLEAGCYFADERITDYSQVLNVLVAVSKTADERLFKLILVTSKEAEENGTQTTVRVLQEDGTFGFFAVKDLYIVNGELMNRDWFLNTSLGYIGAAISTEVAH